MSSRRDAIRKRSQCCLQLAQSGQQRNRVQVRFQSDQICLCIGARCGMRQQTTHGVAGGWWRFAPVLDFDANLNDGWNTFTNRRAEAYSSANRVAAATPLIAPVAYKTTDHRAVLLPQA